MRGHQKIIWWQMYSGQEDEANGEDLGQLGKGPVDL